MNLIEVIDAMLADQDYSDAIIEFRGDAVTLSTLREAVLEGDTDGFDVDGRYDWDEDGSIVCVPDNEDDPLELVYECLGPIDCYVLDAVEEELGGAADHETVLESIRKVEERLGIALEDEDRAEIVDDFMDDMEGEDAADLPDPDDDSDEDRCCGRHHDCGCGCEDGERGSR